MASVELKKSVIRKAKIADWIAKYIITIGGVMIIGSVVLILMLIVAQTLPLFMSAQAKVLRSTTIPDSVSEQTILATGIQMSPDEEVITCYFLCGDATVHVMNLLDFRIIDLPDRIRKPDGAENARIVAAESFGQNDFSVLWDNGAVSFVQVHMVPKFDEDGGRFIEHSVATRETIPSPGDTMPSIGLIRIGESGSATRAALLPDNRIHIYRKSVTEGLLGNTQTEEHDSYIASDRIDGAITAMTMDLAGETIYAGTDRGQLIRWELSDDGSVDIEEYVDAFADDRKITALTMVFGDVSVAVGDSKGGMTTWFPVRRENGDGWELRKIHTLKTHQNSIRAIHASRRNKGLISLDDDGAAYLDHMTSERNLLRVLADQPLSVVGYSPRGNAMVGVDKYSGVFAWKIDNPHPETSWKTLFGKVHYEGYQHPDYVWQTTGGEDFEPKFSLVPLVFGTFKATIYAMLFSVPLALFGAVYVSKFTSPDLRGYIKPVVEIMAAVPSVVIGFLAALWLAPIFARHIVSVFLTFVTIPGVFVIFMVLWAAVREQDWAKRIERGYEFTMLLPIVALGVLLAALLAPMVESTFFMVDMGGAIGEVPNFRQWLFSSLDIRYDQRNSIIIAFALGFAVIPIIFSIAEDSLTNVPRSLTAASLALGASRWQTVWRVVLPSASPGIFAAIMIGFGRAIGETMIVLMATGNTPIIDWSPFNGMRTLSANIAVEIPEAPVDGTLYRTLFLCAVLLFCLTFVLNTVAEIVRDRLRRKYGRF